MKESYAIVQETRNNSIRFRVYSSRRRWLPNSTYDTIDGAYNRVRAEQRLQHPPTAANVTRPRFKWPERECTHEHAVTSKERSGDGEVIGEVTSCPDCGWST